MKDELSSYRAQAVSAAKDFKYGKDVIEKIKKAETICEINRIMITARREKFG